MSTVVNTYRWTIHNRKTGVLLGVYEGATKDEALDAMARDAGCDSFEDVPNRNRDELQVALA